MIVRFFNIYWVCVVYNCNYVVIFFIGDMYNWYLCIILYMFDIRLGWNIFLFNKLFYLIKVF